MPHVLPLSLENRRPGRIRPELGPLRAALALLGDPQLASPSILIVGTNGKGSTAAMLESVLSSHGVVTGLTTSPHLVSVEERIRIGGEAISRADLERHLERLEPMADLTFFETITAVAFLAFAEAGVDVAVLEAGMGGSWDATRVAGSVIAGITNVGSDHAEWLGEDAVERARDKGVPLQSARWAVIGPDLETKLVPALGAPHAIAAWELISVTPVGGDGLRIGWDDNTAEFPLPLVGAHQVSNTHLALALARCAEAAGLAPPLEPETIVRALDEVCWPGRLSTLCLDGREILVDGAHNQEGAMVLASHLGDQAGRRNLLFSCLEDKEVEAMAGVLTPAVGEIVVIELDDDRAMSIERLAAAFPGAVRAPDLLSALGLLSDPVVAAGSLRLVGSLMDLAKEGAGS